MATTAIHRLTAFKVPNPADLPAFMEAYAQLAKDAKKGGKPYLLRCVAGVTENDARNQGYSVMAQTTFASLEDMKYYDESCEAHAALKAKVKGKIAPPPLTMYTQAAEQPL